MSAKQKHATGVFTTQNRLPIKPVGSSYDILSSGTSANLPRQRYRVLNRKYGAFRPHNESFRVAIPAR